MKIIERIKRKLIKILRNFFLFRIGAFLRSFKKKPLPSSKPVLIHIGCGEFNDPTYINVDTRAGWHIHSVDSIENCENLFPANYADLIYACHVLEHVSHLKIRKTLNGLRKCLKKGGILRLSVPDFDKILEMYQEENNIDDIIAPLMGGQGYPGNFHCAVFNEDYLKQLLLKSGFRETRKWDPNNASYHNFNDWSRRKINLYGKEWSISLNLEAVK
jgi:hypothetical protein